MRQRFFCMLTALAILHFASNQASGEWPQSYRLDANLYDVCFVDPQTGWAVGDRGTILKTADGGATWHLQTSFVECRLESVHFLDPNVGWAVGGYVVPYSHRAIGVLLKTRDGGQTWTQQDSEFLPWLTQIEFVDAQRGFAIGRPSAMFPSAVFRTVDAGKHWTPWPGTSSGGIFASFNKQGEGLIIERDGRLTKAGLQRLRPLSNSPLGRALPKQLQMSSAAQGLICGNQGRIGWTRDGGASWSKPPNLPQDAWLAEYDWLAMAGHGRRAWIAGVPGSHVLHTRDGGQSWELQKTGQNLPVFSIQFVDAQHGWAVGAMGTILSTTDGGETWQLQSSNGPRRLAVTTVVSSVDDVPWEFLAQASAGEGFLSSVEVLSGPVPRDRTAGTVPISSRLHDAATSVGCAGANIIQSLPVAHHQLDLTAAQITKNWDLAIAGDSRDQLTEYLVRQFRLYRPEMVVIGDDGERSPGSFELCREIVRSAVARAADPQSFPTQIELGGLQAWQVRQIATRAASASDQAYRVTATRLALPLGRSNSNLADQARSTLATNYVVGPDVLLFDIVGYEGVVRDRRKRTRLFDTAAISRGERMHRIDLTINDNFRQMHRQVQQRRTIETLLRSADETRATRLEQVTQLLRDLPDTDRGDLLFQAAMRLESKDQCSEAFALLTELSRMPEHRLTESARILQFVKLASEEGLLHWTFPAENKVQHVTTSSFQVPSPDHGVQPAAFERPVSERHDPSSTPARQVDAQVAEQRRQKALDAAKEIQLTQPDLYFEPMIRCPLAALHRRIGRHDESERFWRSQLANQSDPFWKRCAANEMALMQRDKKRSPTLHVCRLTKTPPFLDGELDDDVWAGIEAMTLEPKSHAARELKAELHWAWDDRFLFLAAYCHRPPGGRSVQATESRRRDADLSDHDRLTLRLDTDRDYRTYWQLVIDDRGWAVDALNDDRSWNPTWYIAAHDNDKSWTVEIAIPWDQISPDPPQAGEAWALGVHRIVPGQGLQSWCQGDADLSRGRFGLLMFE